MAKLTARGVAALKAPGMHGDGGGLYLDIAPGGSRSWILRFQLAGRRRDMGLGSADLFSLAEARDKALAARRMIAEGVDPIEARRTSRTSARAASAAAVTFRMAAERYIAAHNASWRNPKHRAQWTSTLATYVFPVFGDLPVEAVAVGHVMSALEPIWSTKPETAGRVRGRIEAVLDWSTARGYRTGENPARWKGHLENLLPKKTKVRRVEHHAALAYRDMPAFMAHLRQQGGSAARALEFAILTAAVIGARWEEIDIADRLWTIPAERMKAGREHRVALSDAALAVLEEMAKIRSSEYLFPGAHAGRPLSNMALLMTLRRMVRGDLTAHGFRSTFSDWCAEQTTFPAEVREMALAHAVGDKVEAAYRRGDLLAKRRGLADAWSAFCGAR